MPLLPDIVTNAYTLRVMSVAALVRRVRKVMSAAALENSIYESERCLVLYLVLLGQDKNGFPIINDVIPNKVIIPFYPIFPPIKLKKGLIFYISKQDLSSIWLFDTFNIPFLYID